MTEGKSIKLPAVSVETGETRIFKETTRLSELNIAEGAVIAVPEGKSLTMTVNGVETGGILVTTAGVETRIAAGTYRGDIILTVAEANEVPYGMGGIGMPPGSTPPPPTIYPFRQALYLDKSGIVKARSVPAAVSGTMPATGPISGIKIISTGENFNGIYAAGGSHTIKNAKIEFTGNGRSDFIGYGAAILSTGEKTKLVVDGADIKTKGVVRTGIVADGGSNIIIKNSTIQTDNGVIPSDYIPTIDTNQMRAVPWMLALSGNVRTTNLLGTNTKATYINSSLSSEGWGVLSTDGCSTPKLTVINCKIGITGLDGYGSYVIGDATERFLGCEFNNVTYATINRGGSVYFGDSSSKEVARLNKELDLGLTEEEINSISVKHTVVNSRRFGVMWHGGGTAEIAGGTIFNTKEAIFLNKDQEIKINVDGSQGVQLNTANGVILQVIENDDVGPAPDMSNTNAYHEPVGTPVRVESFDLTDVHPSDAIATFTNILLKGDFYNAIRGGLPTGGGPGGGPGGMPGGPGPGPGGKNMALTFNNTGVTGVISASESRHGVNKIDASNYWELGAVTNTPRSAVNNGVIVYLNSGSKWTVTGKSYLTKLDIAADAVVTAPQGRKLTMTVDGVITPLKPGTYKGDIILTVN